MNLNVYGACAEHEAWLGMYEMAYGLASNVNAASVSTKDVNLAAHPVIHFLNPN